MIKKWIQKILEGNTPVDPIEWRTENSLLQFISTHIDINGRFAIAHDLPDKKEEEGQLRFAPGAMDAMLRNDDTAEAKTTVDQLTALLKQVATQADKTSGYAFYQLVTERDGVIGIIDDFLEKVLEEQPPITPHLQVYITDLITKTGHRNAVKIGISLAGLSGNTTVIPAIKTLALHDEFTLYAAVALLHLSKTPATDLWELAQKVDGWGKIHLVNRFADMELSPEMEDWLIREGYKNKIMYEYLAYSCATYGLLHDKLEAPIIDSGLFKAAGEIIVALINEGAAVGISQYEGASVAVEHFIRHAKEHAQDLSDFITLDSIKSFLTELVDDIGEHEKNGWTQDTLSNCLIDVAGLLNNGNWERLTKEALTSNDDHIYWDGKRAADILDMNIWDIFWQRLQQQPLDSTSWYDVTWRANAKQADAVIDFALAHLPLAEYSTGPADELGLGEQFNKYHCLDYITTFLEDYPGKGEPLILASLHCPVTRNRNMALKALEKWTSQYWSQEILESVKKLSEIEPNKDTKKRIDKLLKAQQEH
jgi:hypothetical protein